MGSFGSSIDTFNGPKAEPNELKFSFKISIKGPILANLSSRQILELFAAWKHISLSLQIYFDALSKLLIH